MPYSLIVLRWIFAPVLAHRRALLALTLVYFGRRAAGDGLHAGRSGDPSHPAAGRPRGFLAHGGLGPLVEAYQNGRLAAAIVLAFVVNLVLGSGLALSLTSLVIPFGGLLVGIFRALLWGFSSRLRRALWPGDPSPRADRAPGGGGVRSGHAGGWLWWWPVFTTGSRWQAWRQGLLLQGRIYVAVASCWPSRPPTKRWRLSTWSSAGAALVSRLQVGCSGHLQCRLPEQRARLRLQAPVGHLAVHRIDLRADIDRRLLAR